MMKALGVLTTVVCFGLGVSLTAVASPTVIDCSYSYMSYPFSRDVVSLGADETPAPFVTIYVQGQAHKESLTPDQRADGELLHAWISKESADNSVEMIVYREPQAQGQSKMINHHVPMGQEVWGTCQLQ